MALSTILKDLKLMGPNLQDQSAYNRYKRDAALYDVVIRINSLEDLQTHGWEIAVQNYNEKHLSLINTNSEISSGVVVGIVGAYNRGKTFLLSKLCNVNFPHNKLTHTDGISITAGGKDYKEIIFMDTAGTDTPIEGDKLRYKRATEALLREVIVHLCSVIIIVVNRLRATDQIYIDKVLEYCNIQGHKKHIIIVHNLNDMETTIEVDKIIKEEITEIFKASICEKQFRISGKTISIPCYLSKSYNFEISHFILAKEGSQAGKFWNQKSLDGIMNIFQLPLDVKPSFKLISAITEYFNTRIQDIFQNQTNLSIVQHETKPFIVLDDRKDLENLDEEPHTLTLSERLVYDDGGYFIKSRNGQWEPRYNLHEYTNGIHVVLELPGFKKGEVKTLVTETNISVSGIRDSFGIQAQTTSSTHVSQIPTGEFKLNIPLKCPIDKTTLKIERNEGIIIITASKKNLDAQEIEI